MAYNPKKVAKLIAMREEGLDEMLKPRLMEIVKIIATVKHGLGIRDTVGSDFAAYISSGGCADKEEISFAYYCAYPSSKSRLELSFNFSVNNETDYPLGYSITMPAEFATCEDKDLKKVVITQIYNDLFWHAKRKRREYKEAAEQVKEFLEDNGEFISNDTDRGSKEEGNVK